MVFFYICPYLIEIKSFVSYLTIKYNIKTIKKTWSAVFIFKCRTVWSDLSKYKWSAIWSLLFSNTPLSSLWVSTDELMRCVWLGNIQNCTIGQLQERGWEPLHYINNQFFQQLSNLTLFCVCSCQLDEFCCYKWKL